MILALEGGVIFRAFERPPRDGHTTTKGLECSSRQKYVAVAVEKTISIVERFEYASCVEKTRLVRRGVVDSNGIASRFAG
jgi:hypothetical protein